MERPISYSKMEPFPLGAITAEGFLRDQLLRSKNGMGGHLDELEPDMIANPFVNKTKVPQWGDADQSGWGAEISGNFWTGLINLAFTLNDEELIAKATRWVDAVLPHQKPDGYLGTYYEDDANIFDDYNPWGTSCMLRGLLAFYEATGRQDVLDAVHNCLLWFTKTWTNEHKTTYAAQFIIDPLVRTYRLTGDRRLVDYAVEYEEFQADHDYFRISYRSMNRYDLEYNSNHTGAFGSIARLPAMLYSVTGKTDYLRGVEKTYDQVYTRATQLTGAPISCSEFIAPVCSNGETEYCSFSFFNSAYAELAAITGKSKYGDRAEEMFYNGAQGGRKKDEKAIAYLSAVNQIHATNRSSTGGADCDMQAYAPCYTVSCCPVNAVLLLGEFVRWMMFRGGENDLYVSVYGPCTLRDGDLTVREITDYPFRDTVRFEIEGNREFTFYLRDPKWSRGAKITVNGEAVMPEKTDLGFLGIRRAWKTGDVIEVAFAFEVEVVKVNDIDACAKFPIALRRGPLVFSYPVPERWEPYVNPEATPLPEGWSWYNVYPVVSPMPDPEKHNQLGLKRYFSPWFLALDEKMKAEDVAVEFVDTDGYAWESPRVKLRLKAYRAPFAYSAYPIRTFDWFGDTQTVDKETEIELVPYGCTNLRVTYFPRAKFPLIKNPLPSAAACRT